jgi:hypothetical protein
MVDNSQLITSELDTLQGITTTPKQQRQQRMLDAMEQRKPVRYTLRESNGKTAIVQTETDPMEYALSLFETTGAENPNTALHLVDQLRSVLPNKLDASGLNAATDLMSSIQPQDAMEGMLAAQMVACHTMAMTFAQRATALNQPDKAVESNLNRSTKMMRLFSQHMEALHKIRHKGQQTIQVQHIHLDGVQQAIVGNNVGIPTPERGQG